MAGPPPPFTANGPPEGQTYCLRWNNHKSNLVEILDSLIKIETYVDCTIVVDDQVQFKAHRVVLAANSPYFQTILQDLPMDHCSIIFPGVKAFEMRALLEYMYTGEVNVTQSQIPKIMRIAEELEVKGLFDMADLKEKFNKLSEEYGENMASNPYTNITAPSNPYCSVSSVSSRSVGITNTKASLKKEHDNYRNNSPTMISTSSNISPSAAPSSSSSPPYSNCKSPYISLYTKSPGPNASQSCSATQAQSSQQSTINNLTPTSERSAAQWPLSPSMLSSAYESAPDMNPLKRKKLSSRSSMLMNRDTPILRNVLAQATPADSSQPLPLLLPPNASDNNQNDKSSSSVSANLDKNLDNHIFNGSAYGDKRYIDEPHSPFTDRSFEDDSFVLKHGNISDNFSNNSNKKAGSRHYKKYTKENLAHAIQAVRNGMSPLKAAQIFKIPSRTLYDKCKKLGITTGRPMNRTLKRNPSSAESSAAFPYAHGYGQTAAMHDAVAREESELKDQLRNSERHHLTPSIPHSAAALLDHAFLQQAIENRGGGDLAGREALHAMALAAAAHAAANSNCNAVRSPSPTKFTQNYNNLHSVEQELMERQELERQHERECKYLEHERERERELQLAEQQGEEDDDDRVEDLSVTRKGNNNTPTEQCSESPFSHTPLHKQGESEKTVIMSTKLSSNRNSNDHNASSFINDTSMKREIVIDDVRAD